MALMLLPTAAASGPVQLQIIPRTKGFLELVELGVLDAGVFAAAVVFEVVLCELLEPQALRPIDPTTSTHDNSASRLARRIRKIKLTLL